MTASALGRRLDKLEAVHSPRGVCFMAWGRDAEDADAVAQDALARRTVKRGDLVARMVWPVEQGMPASRWVREGHGAFSRPEMAVLGLYAEQRIEALPLPAPEPGAAPWPHPDTRPHYLGQLWDAQLVAQAFGEPIDLDAPAGPARDDLAFVLREIDSRALIRGCSLTEVVDVEP